MIYGVSTVFTINLYIIMSILLILSSIKDREKTKLALIKAWKSFEKIMPQFLSILLLIGIIMAVVSPNTISTLIGSGTGWLGMTLASIIGSITLIPGFIACPLAASLLDNGAGIMQIAVFISTLMMVGVVTLPMEVTYLGKKAAFTRNGIALLYSFAAAVLIGVILG